LRAVLSSSHSSLAGPSRLPDFVGAPTGFGLDCPADKMLDEDSRKAIYSLTLKEVTWESSTGYYLRPDLKDPRGGSVFREKKGSIYKENLHSQAHSCVLC